MSYDTPLSVEVDLQAVRIVAPHLLHDEPVRWPIRGRTGFGEQGSGDRDQESRDQESGEQGGIRAWAKRIVDKFSPSG